MIFLRDTHFDFRTSANKCKGFRASGFMTNGGVLVYYKTIPITKKKLREQIKTPIDPLSERKKKKHEDCYS